MAKGSQDVPHQLQGQKARMDVEKVLRFLDTACKCPSSGFCSNWSTSCGVHSSKGPTASESEQSNLNSFKLAFQYASLRLIPKRPWAAGCSKLANLGTMFTLGTAWLRFLAVESQGSELDKGCSTQRFSKCRQAARTGSWRPSHCRLDCQSIASW